jgi:hypothetical protein
MAKKTQRQLIEKQLESNKDLFASLFAVIPGFVNAANPNNPGLSYRHRGNEQELTVIKMLLLELNKTNDMLEICQSLLDRGQ